MTSHAEEDRAHRCPALDATARWDDPEHLRGPILSPVRLAEHARDVASHHGEPAQKGQPGLVYRRYRATRTLLQEAYAILTRDVRTVREATPAEEWLLDNAHIIEDQLREVAVDLPRGYLAKLPRVSHGVMRGVPRVYALCLDYLRHNDARVEADSLIAYVSAYQSVHALSIGELWAVPIMLRIGLLMMVSRVAHEQAMDRSVTEADALAAELAKADDPRPRLDSLARHTLTPSFLVELKRKALEAEHDNGPLLAWLSKVAKAQGTSAEELSRLHHLRRAEDQLTVGNAITSMRAISAYDWSRFFASTSFVESILIEDPGESYALSDAGTRDRMRHAVERIARTNERDEREVARAAIRLAEAAQSQGGAQAHVGFYLIDAGRPALERALKARAPVRDLMVRWAERFGATLYLVPLCLGTALFLWLAHTLLTERTVSTGLSVGILVCLSVALSEMSLGLVNSAVMASLPPRVLPKLSFKRGVPAEHRTLVVVPALLDSEETCARLLADLEIRALANPDAHLYFALLTDFCDANEPTLAGDQALLDQALMAVAELNRRHPKSPYPRFSLLHRRRLENRAEGCFMGWERKRGKLEELNRLILDEGETSFAVVTCPRELLTGVRYVITLDADTELPRGAARKLVSAMAHPLNRPVLDERGRRVVRGYGVIQPRVGTTPASSRRSLFSRISAGAPGIDPYTTAVSDVYQDLFAEGSYVGKGIYDVRAFASALSGRVPENSLLSHDLFEGLFARAALASDIEVLDDQPASYAVEARRQHRWMRGDYQLLPHLLRSSGLPWFSSFKVLDNLRRALLAPSLVIGLVIALALAPAAVPLVVSVTLLVCFTPVLVRLLANLVRPPEQGMALVRWPLLWGDFRTNSARALVNLTFLLDGAFLALDAIARTLYRLTISRTRLLEWTSTGQAERLFKQGKTDPEPRLVGSAITAAAMLALCAARTPANLAWFAPMGLLWAFAPVLARLLGRDVSRSSESESLLETHRPFVRRTARKTWRFFETFVSAEDHWLAPDNYQEEPKGVIAHRTSPTNIGMYLLSCLTAKDLGFVTFSEFVDRVSATFDTIERLETFRGHLLNWYDTSNLHTLAPKYVSMVDSGNLLGHLWTLAVGLDEQPKTSLGVGPLLEAVEDALRLAREHGAQVDASLAHLSRAREHALQTDLVGAFTLLRGLSAGLPEVRESDRSESEGAYWQAEARAAVTSWLAERELLAPHLEHLARAPVELLSDPEFRASRERLAAPDTLGAMLEAVEAELPRIEAQRAGATGDAEAFLLELERRLRRGLDATQHLCARMAREASRARGFADRMDFTFLYDEDRALFAIGYNVELGKLDGSRYDLLASEARLGSFVAIAKGDVPEEHWFHLGRTRVQVNGRAGLVAWSGSMFEHLMPLLVMKRCEGTLLDETYDTVVDVHRAYGAARNVPWGVSESAYNVMDLHMTYQYRAFGVQSLGLKAGLGDDTVIAPYATALCTLVQPNVAVENLLRLARERFEGPCGFYEAIDFTPERVPPGKNAVVVKAYMAHHQGMTLVALGNVLCGEPMQRRFHTDPRVKATELLLEERAPLGVPPLAERVIESPVQSLSDEELSHVERFALRDEPGQRAHLLGHGELATLIGARGFGYTTWRDLDVHRFREDTAHGPSGTFVYVRDRKSGRLWSAGFEPTRAKADEHFVELSPDKVRFQRRDGDVETIMELVVSPEFPAELRRITLGNLGKDPVELDVTTYAETILAPRAADLSHRAFNNLFVVTEALPERSGVLTTKSPRRAGDFQPYCLQTLVADAPHHDDSFELETSRSAFLGRGGSYELPRALTSLAKLSGTTGHVLDPAVALRRTVTIAPGERARLTLTTALADSRAGAIAVSDALTSASGVTRTFELAWADARVELKHLGISGLVSHRFQRLLSALLYPDEGLRDVPSTEPRGQGLPTLWSLGISGDFPILLVRLDDLELTDLVRDVLLAHEFFRINNVQVDLLLWNEEPAGYLSPVHDKALQVVRATASQGRLDQRGGVFLRQASRLSPSERALVLSAARVTLSVTRGSLARQLRKVQAEPVEEARLGGALQRPERHSEVRDALSFDNGIGGFARGGREYVMRVSAEQKPPLPWSNVMGRADFGTLVTESGGGFTWSGNSQRHRLTSFSNDPVLDPAGDTVFVRDDAEGRVFSATPSPRPLGAMYTVRHGQGYSAFERAEGDLSTDLTVFLHPTHTAKVALLRIRNQGNEARTLSVFGFADLSVGLHRDRSRHTIVTRFEAGASAVLAENAFSTRPERCTYLTTNRPVESFTGDRTDFVGRDGSLRAPSGLVRSKLGKVVGAGLDPCAALHVRLTVAPGATESVHFVFGDAASRDEASAVCQTMDGDAAAWLSQATQFWDDILGRVEVKTPDESLDIMVNRWLPYQTLGCRIWGRSAFYQSGGAYGYRDQLQDVLALLHARPDVARAHLLAASARQFREGDVQHWWHPETGEGVRTFCSDDLVFLPFALVQYVRVTGDTSILDEQVPFLDERLLKKGEHDLYSVPRVSSELGSMYEHALRALRKGTTQGPHGLPLMGAGDWNDGMDRVGAKGVGESVWLGWFLARVWQDFGVLARQRGDADTADRARGEVTRLSDALHAHAWDGDWFRRAYMDDGTPLGSKESPECRIDAIAQSWAQLSGIADPDLARRALDASLEHLCLADPGMMLLLTPPFTQKNDQDPGYIRAYPPGIRENGGQYTHGVLWTVQALFSAGACERGHTLLSMLNPIHHGKTRDAVARYQAEPFAVAADVYAAPEHLGRAGWTWYTGAAGWMYRIALEDMLGIQVRGEFLELRPRVPASWTGFSVRYRRGQSLYVIEFDNPAHLDLGRAELDVVVDGHPVPAQRIPFKDDGGEHSVRVRPVEARVALPRASAR